MQTGGQVSPESILQTTANETSGSESIIVALGALLGLSILLLAVVTIGWVGTCVSMKKLRREKSDNSEMIESTEQNRYVRIILSQSRMVAVDLRLLS